MLRYLIGVDIGTSGTKSIIADETGKVIASKTRSIRCTRRGPAGLSRSPRTGGKPW